MEIVPDVHQISGTRGCNVYLLAGTRLSLIDTGLPGNVPRIEAYIRRIGRSPAELDLILLTHYHPDHTGSAPELYRRHGCRVAIHEAEAAYLEGRLPGATLRTWGLAGRGLALARRLIPVEEVPVAVALRDGDEVDLLGGSRVLHTPGHTAGSICLHVPGRRLLFTGDAVVRKPWGLSMPSFLFTVDRSKGFRSLSRLSSLEVETVCFGHGRPILRAGGVALTAFAHGRRTW